MVNLFVSLFSCLTTGVAGILIGLTLCRAYPDSRSAVIRISKEEVYSNVTGANKGDTFIVVAYGDTVQNMTYNGRAWIAN